MDAGLAIKVGGQADPQLAGAVRVEVQERMGEPATFRLRYQVTNEQGDLPLLTDGRFDPGSEIQVLVIRDGKAQCLVKGPVHAQQIHLVHGGAESWIEVVGSDTSITMDREVKQALWDASKDSDAVRSIVGGYGFDPDVEDTAATHEEAKHVLVQYDSDLRFVRRLARRNGFLFWIDADPEGKQKAHFKRPPLDGDPAAKLVINLDPPNVSALDLSWDVERPTSTEGMQLALNDKGDIDGSAPKSPLKPLGAKSFADVAKETRTAHVAPPVDDAGDLRARGEGALVEAGWFVRATGETTVFALGAVLRAHTVVELHGAGKRHAGRYFVAGVRHLIDSAAHRMEFELLRNAWGA